MSHIQQYHLMETLYPQSDWVRAWHQPTKTAITLSNGRNTTHGHFAGSIGDLVLAIDDDIFAVSHSAVHILSALDSLWNSAFQLILDNPDQNLDTLCRWANQLNMWEWPHDLPGKPPDFDSLSDIKFVSDDGRGYRRIDHEAISKHFYVWPIIDKIHQRVPRKEILRYWNVTMLQSMSNQGFEQWWKKLSGRL